MGEDERIDEESVKGNLVSLDIAEYSALMGRATTFVTLAAGMWPLIGLYIAVVIQLSKPESGSLSTAYQHLLQMPLRRALMMWGNLFIIGSLINQSIRFTVDQYTIVFYIERNLAKKVSEQIKSTRFWGYEQFLKVGRRGIQPWEYAMGVALIIGMSIAACLLWPLGWYDAAGIGVDFYVLKAIFLKYRELVRMRTHW